MDGSLTRTAGRATPCLERRRAMEAYSFVVSGAENSRPGSERHAMPLRPELDHRALA